MSATFGIKSWARAGALAATLGMASLANAVSAQTVMLVADTVFVTSDSMLTAQGHVEAIQGDMRLSARRITYDRRYNRLTVEGPIRIQRGNDVEILAESAELDPEFHSALITSARLVLNQQLQLAAREINRVNGRYTQLQKVAATSCKICANDETPPIWQIRARRVVHDEDEKQLYFDEAQLRFFDVPVFYLPRMRLPDPSVTRATGFLIPSLKRSSLLGTGIRIPYFVEMGPHRDLLFTPYLSEKSRTLEWRYRQALSNGEIQFDGAISDDSLTADQWRGYIHGEGLFELPRDFELSFEINAASDTTYLLDYDYSDEDRLRSDITLARTMRDEDIEVALMHYHTLRDTEDNMTLPSIVAMAEYEKRYFPEELGGEARVSLAAHAHYRYSDLNIDGPDLDSIVDGRDVARLNAELSWRKTWTLDYGLRANVLGELAFDTVHTDQDATILGGQTYVTPAIAMGLRWPLSKTTANGVTYGFEPVAQIGWVGGKGRNIANDESTRVEFDEGNLLSLSRFPEPDRREHGASLAIGVNWSRYDPDGWSANLALGQVLRENDTPDFSRSSGLRGADSDLLVAGQLKWKNGLAVSARALVNEDDGVNKAEWHAGWSNHKIGLDASYVWLGVDPDEDRPGTQSEWALDGSYRFNDHWTGLANVRYDVAQSSTAKAGVGLEYRNECMKMDFSVSRRFTSSTTLRPSTDISFTVELLGFGTSAVDQSYQRKCRSDAK